MTSKTRMGPWKDEVRFKSVSWSFHLPQDPKLQNHLKLSNFLILIFEQISSFWQGPTNQSFTITKL